MTDLIDEKALNKGYNAWKREFANGDITEKEVYRRSIIKYEAAKHEALKRRYAEYATKEPRA